MITDGEKDVLARLLQRLEAETERLDRLEADNAQLRSEIDSLRRRRPTPSTSASTEDHGDVSPCDDHDQPLSRRGMLSRLAGAGAAGLGLAAGASVLAVKPAGATDVGALQLGHDNLAGVNRTLLQSSSNFPTLQVGNVGFGEGRFCLRRKNGRGCH